MNEKLLEELAGRMGDGERENYKQEFVGRRPLVRDQEIGSVPIGELSQFGPEISHREASLPAKQQPG